MTPMRKTARAVAFAAATTLAAAGFVAAGAASASAAATPLPAHVYAPYWESYVNDNPQTLEQESGAKYLTAAFFQTASAGSCTAYWDGSTGEPIASSTYGSQISAIQAAGGNVIPSFGGYTADTTDTDIADSCTNVNSIAAAYESAITAYNVPRIDLDVEQDSLTNSAGINRRNEAIAQVESWAAANGRSIQFSYTLPVTATGLTSDEVSILQNAVTDKAKISVVNIMTFDYYTGQTYEMAGATESAAAGLESQLASVYPGDSASQLWGLIGVTEMPGIDDYGSAETFTEADASTVLNWAESKGINTLSIWAIERDNGGCVGTGGQDSCSGIAQSTWYFDHAFEPFTNGSGGGTTPPPSGGGAIVNNNSSLCLGDTGDSSTLKTTGDIASCDSSAAQTWTAENGTLVDGNNLCLSVTGSSTALKAVTDIYTCNGSASENWTVNSNGTIVNTTSGLCLSVTGSSTTSGATTDIYTCNSSASENWTTAS
jgi:hypothetical protein